jgi:hypothetical protein
MCVDFWFQALFWQAVNCSPQTDSVRDFTEDHYFNVINVKQSSSTYVSDMNSSMSTKFWEGLDLYNVLGVISYSNSNKIPVPQILTGSD